MENKYIQEIAEIQQSRSEFQIRFFVLGQHPTPEMQFYQCCIEIQDMQHKINFAALTRKKLEVKIKKLLASDDEEDHIEAQIVELELEQQTLAEIGAKRELEVLYECMEQLPHFTREEIERAQPDYWQQRLVTQAELQRIGAMLGINWAHAESLNNANLLHTLPAFRELTENTQNANGSIEVS